MVTIWSQFDLWSLTDIDNVPLTRLPIIEDTPWCSEIQIFICLYRNRKLCSFLLQYRHMKVRISEHQGVSPRTGKPIKGTLSTSVRDHMLNCNHRVAWKDFSIIGRELNHYLLETKESLFIKRDNPSFNRNKYSPSCFYSNHLSRIIFVLIIQLW